jgi:uncharacterized membrane protein YoaK (UPF0700 family)
MASATSSTPPAVARPPWAGLIDGFTAGYVDTLGFVALFGLFTAHVTGNFVVLGSSLVHNQAGAALTLLAFPAFIAGVAATRVATLIAAHRGRTIGGGLLRAQAVLLTVFMTSGVLAPQTPGPDSVYAMLTGLLGVLAMSVQNARGRLDGTTPNTVMTGNVTQFIIDAVDLAHGVDAGLKPAIMKRLRVMGLHILAFTLGAAGGAFGYLWFGYWALLLPIGLLFLVPVHAPAPMRHP